MQLRVFVVCVCDELSNSLTMFVESLGHQVIQTAVVDSCPHFASQDGNCSQDHPCGDAIIVCQDLPGVRGIDFIERRLKGGCKGSALNNLVVCRPWAYREEEKARELGINLLETPTDLTFISRWLEDIQRSTPADRVLAEL